MPAEPNRPILAAAGLCGALGVGVAAAASHGGSAELGIAGNFLLFHAPVLLGLSLFARNRLATAAALVLTLSLALFAGDLATRALAGHALFAFAAPIGGTGLIVAWLLVVAAALVRPPAPPASR